MKASHETSSAKFTMYPLAWASAALAVGITIASQVTLSFFTPILVVLLLLTVIAILLKQSNITVTIILTAFALGGGLLYQVETGYIKQNRLKVIYDGGEIASGEEVKVSGIVAREPEPAVNGFYLYLDVEKLQRGGEERTVSGRVRLFAAEPNDLVRVEFDALSIKAGDRVEILTKLKREERFINPGVRSAKENLDRQGLDATGTIRSSEDVIKTGEVFISPLNLIYTWRRMLLDEFRAKFNVPTAGVLIASLLGNKYHLDKPTAESFREGGTFHLLVISGAHITVLGALAVWLFSFATNNRLRLFIISNVVLWAYSLAVGAEAPVVRAAIMFSVLSFSYVVQRQGTLLNSLGAGALLLLVWKPSDLFDPSFQLTFVCVFAIVAVAVPLVQKMEAIGAWEPEAGQPLPPNVSSRLKTFCEALFWDSGKWRREQKRSIWQCGLFKTPWAARLESYGVQSLLRYLFAAALVSVIVQLWLMPFMIVYFHRVSPVGVVLNLFVGIMLAAETLIALFALLLSMVSSTMASPLIWLAETLNWAMLHSVDPFDALDVSVLRVPVYSGWARMIYVIYFLPLVVLWRQLMRWDPFAYGNKKERTGIGSPYFAGAVATMLLAVVILHSLSAPRADGNLRVDFLDVGQGDSALLTFPDGQTMLIDGGGRFNFSQTTFIGDDGQPRVFEADVPSIGEAVVSEVLWERGMDTVDHIVATHGDLDHIQGLNDVARNFNVRSAFVGAAQKPSGNLSEFYSNLKRQNITVTHLSRGDVLKFGEVIVEVLSPSAETAALSENNNSLVLKVTYGARSFLFTGDIEKRTEGLLLMDAASLKCDVVKVAHHGSRSSSMEEFVRATGAKTTVISVGRDSPFGHPHREVVERWQNSGANTMTTGSNGMITIITDGQNVRSDRP